jgi:hypothetical protein
MPRPPTALFHRSPFPPQMLLTHGKSGKGFYQPEPAEPIFFKVVLLFTLLLSRPGLGPAMVE